MRNPVHRFRALYAVAWLIGAAAPAARQPKFGTFPEAVT
jgi:hypothetical protein